MMFFRIKTYQEVLEFDYSVCEVDQCTEKSEKLAMTETRFVDFCAKHYKVYILGGK